jgi:mannose-6-phosphate isomerase-like protein (cupin superfamily)
MRLIGPPSTEPTAICEVSRGWQSELRTIEERFKLSAGQAVLFEPRDPHYTINEGEEESVYLVITVKQ